MDSKIRSRLTSVLHFDYESADAIHQRGIGLGYNWGIDNVCAALRAMDRDGIVSRSESCWYALKRLTTLAQISTTPKYRRPPGPVCRNEMIKHLEKKVDVLTQMLGTFKSDLKALSQNK